jgi:hypothetical protein
MWPGAFNAPIKSSRYDGRGNGHMSSSAGIKKTRFVVPLYGLRGSCKSWTSFTWTLWSTDTSPWRLSNPIHSALWMPDWLMQLQLMVASHLSVLPSCLQAQLLESGLELRFPSDLIGERIALCGNDDDLITPLRLLIASF